MSNVISFPSKPRDYYDNALEQVLMVLAGLRDTPECRQLQQEMRRQWLHQDPPDRRPGDRPWIN